jgi:uncharacterized protein (DUF2141 family)
MKTVSILLVALGMSVLTTSFTKKNYFPNSTLTVTVSGFTSASGNICVLLFNQSAGFPTNPDKAYKVIKTKVVSGAQDISIPDLPQGKYSVVVFHDKNANEKFDKNWLGMPKESYGFTNIPSDYCGTPSFEQTSFQISGNSHAVTIYLTH